MLKYIFRIEPADEYREPYVVLFNVLAIEFWKGTFLFSWYLSLALSKVGYIELSYYNDAAWKRLTQTAKRRAIHKHRLTFRRRRFQGLIPQ